jgi:thiamine pyrophosphokinase
MRCCAVQSGRPTRALVVADGDVPPSGNLDELMDPSNGGGVLVVAADGGLVKARALGLQPSVVVGDGDSLPPDVLAGLESQGVDVRLHPRAKDASDTELAVREAADRGATEIVVLGALGGRRFDHALANVLLLTATDIAPHVRLVDGATTVDVIGRHGPEGIELSGAAGDYVSLLPLSEHVDGVTTTGLAYPLTGATLRQGSTLGLSNELSGSRATVAVERGRLAVIQTRREGLV